MKIETNRSNRIGFIVVVVVSFTAGLALALWGRPVGHIVMRAVAALGIVAGLFLLTSRNLIRREPGVSPDVQVPAERMILMQLRFMGVTGILLGVAPFMPDARVQTAFMLCAAVVSMAAAFKVPRRVFTWVLLVFFAGAGAAVGQTVETGFLNRSISLDGNEHRYQVFVPREYRAMTAWPIILALHGGGERGSDGLIQTDVGLGRAIRRHADRFPAIVVFPQAPRNETPGWHAFGSRLALAALDSVMKEFNVDGSRVYLTGLSMGGNGSWYLAYHHADRFAALVVVCGWISDRRAPDRPYHPGIAPADAADPFAAVAQRVSALPVWIFHGDADTVVPVEESRGMAAALRALSADVQYTELPGVGHNAWDPAYDRADLATWLFKQRRRPR